MRPGRRRIEGHLDLFEDAIQGAYDDTENQRPRLDEELSSTEAQLRDVTASIDRYLRASKPAPCPKRSAHPGWPSYPTVAPSWPPIAIR